MSLLSQNITFKKVFTSKVKTLSINPNWTVSQFITIVTPILKTSFRLNTIEIVEAGQDIFGLPSELAKELEPSNTLLKEKWNMNLNVAFYVRRKNWDYNILENRHVSDNQISPIHQLERKNSLNDCMVCFENVKTTRFFGCLHQICNTCVVGCLRNQHNICPQCRR